ncbi:MAG TPA: transglutaminase-like cysteine peptidase [Xanthobacteraceae bacterium]|nr:transglutaminase-like cysteine peptidase [Xanthobacteraceae bacterium]
MKKLSVSPARSIRVALLAAGLAGGAVAPAQAIPLAHGLSVFTAAIERAKAPNGWSAFCARYSSECNKPSNARKIALTAMASAQPAVDWDGANNSAIMAMQDWPISIIWMAGGQDAEQASTTAAYWDASLDVASVFVPTAGIGFAEAKETPSTVASADAPRKIELTPENWEMLVRTNSRVNREIKPVPDRQHFGRPNVWVYPNDGKGDCKAYVLVKQRKLIAAGFPREALLVTIVWTKEKQGHAVLMARTNKGDYILDNLSPKVLLWTQTTHDYVKRQSVSHPNQWVYIDGYRNPQAKMQVAVAQE